MLGRGATTLSIMTLGMTTHSKMTLGIMTHQNDTQHREHICGTHRMTFSITKFSITAFSTFSMSKLS